MDQEVLDGSCLCGRTHVRLLGPPVAVVVCHCTNCQKQGGSAFSRLIIASLEAVQIEGRLRRTLTGRTQARWWSAYFAPTCGSAIQSIVPDYNSRHLTILKAAIFPLARSLVPQIESFCDSAVDLIAPVAGATRFARLPPL